MLEVDFQRKFFCQLHLVSTQKPNLAGVLHFQQNHKSLSWPNQNQKLFNKKVSYWPSLGGEQNLR